MVGLPTKKSDGTEKFATTGSVDSCSVLSETQFVGTRIRVDTIRVLSVDDFFHPIGAAVVKQEFDIKPPL